MERGRNSGSTAEITYYPLMQVNITHKIACKWIFLIDLNKQSNKSVTGVLRAQNTRDGVFSVHVFWQFVLTVDLRYFLNETKLHHLDRILTAPDKHIY